MRCLLVLLLLLGVLPLLAACGQSVERNDTRVRRQPRAHSTAPVCDRQRCIFDAMSSVQRARLVRR